MGKGLVIAKLLKYKKRRVVREVSCHTPLTL